MDAADDDDDIVESILGHRDRGDGTIEYFIKLKLMYRHIHYYIIIINHHHHHNNYNHYQVLSSLCLGGKGCSPRKWRR